MANIKPRKKRSDRNHIIYQLTNTITGEIYIGLTRVIGRAYKKSVLQRWKRHISRAKNQDLDWNLYLSIEEYGHEVFEHVILEIIRGKKPAHQREVDLIKELNPMLNSTHN